jgi:hypothetical protein
MRDKARASGVKAKDLPNKVKLPWEINRDEAFNHAVGVTVSRWDKDKKKRWIRLYDPGKQTIKQIDTLDEFIKEFPNSLVDYWTVIAFKIYLK